MKRLMLSALACAMLLPFQVQAKSCNAGTVDTGFGPRDAGGFPQVGPYRTAESEGSGYQREG